MRMKAHAFKKVVEVTQTVGGQIFPATHVIGIYNNAIFKNMKHVVSKQFWIVV